MMIQSDFHIFQGGRVCIIRFFHRDNHGKFTHTYKYIYIYQPKLYYHVSMNSPSFCNDISPWFIVCIICCWLNTLTSLYIWTHYDDFASQRHWNYESVNFCNIHSPKPYLKHPQYGQKRSTKIRYCISPITLFWATCLQLSRTFGDGERERERSPITGSHMTYGQNFPQWKIVFETSLFLGH